MKLKLMAKNTAQNAKERTIGYFESFQEKN